MNVLRDSNEDLNRGTMAYKDEFCCSSLLRFTILQSHFRAAVGDLNWLTWRRGGGEVYAFPVRSVSFFAVINLANVV